MTKTGSAFVIRRFEGELSESLVKNVRNGLVVRSRIGYAQKASAFLVGMSISMMLAAQYSALSAIGVEVPMLILGLISFIVSRLYAIRQNRLHPIRAQRNMLVLIELWNDCYEVLIEYDRRKTKSKAWPEELGRASDLRRRIENVLIISSLRNGGYSQEDIFRPSIPKIEALVQDVARFKSGIAILLAQDD